MNSIIYSVVPVEFELLDKNNPHSTAKVVSTWVEPKLTPRKSLQTFVKHGGSDLVMLFVALYIYLV